MVLISLETTEEFSLLLRNFSKHKSIKLAQDGGGTGIFSGDSGQANQSAEQGLGIGGPGLSGVPSEISLPAGHQGHSGSGPWSVGTPVESDNLAVNQKYPQLEDKDFTIEQLQLKIKNRMEVGDEQGALFYKQLLKRKNRGERLAYFQSVWNKCFSKLSNQQERFLEQYKQLLQLVIRAEKREWEGNRVIIPASMLDNYEPGNQCLDSVLHRLSIDDWKKFSEKRGYTDKEIANYQKYIEATERGVNELGLSEQFLKQIWEEIAEQLQKQHRYPTDQELEHYKIRLSDPKQHREWILDIKQKRNKDGQAK